MKKKTNSGLKIICLNRKASFNYFFEDIYEAGLILKGSEIKSVRDGKVNIADSYAIERDGELFLINSHISSYKQASILNHNPIDERKLLLKKKEINKLIGKMQREGFTLIPTRMYFKKGKAKIEIAVAKGKNNMIKDKQSKEKTGTEIKQDILENPHKDVFLGIGSNIGNRVNNINNACYLLNNFCFINKVSNFYESNSWPNENYPKYLNVVLKCKTDLDPFSLIKKLKDIEKKLGRKKNIRNFPRTCDIDIIDFRGLKFKKQNIEVPHPRLLKRNFVLLPLFEIEKGWRYPETNITIDKLIKNLDIKSFVSIKIF